MALKGNPIIITAAATWVTTGDVTLNVQEAIWRGLTAGDTLLLARDSAAASGSVQLTARSVSTNNETHMNLWRYPKTFSKLYVKTMSIGHLEIWLL